MSLVAGTKEVSTTSVVVAAANDQRTGIQISTDDADDVFLAFGEAAVAGSGVQLKQDVPVQIMSPICRREIRGITAANTSTVVYQEL